MSGGEQAPKLLTGQQIRHVYHYSSYSGYAHTIFTCNMFGDPEVCDELKCLKLSSQRLLRFISLYQPTHLLKGGSIRFDVDFGCSCSPFQTVAGSEVQLQHHMTNPRHEQTLLPILHAFKSEVVDLFRI